MHIGISLGWDCGSGIYGVENKLRPLKVNGYKTCPFDKMISNYEGIIQCIKEDFKDFCNTDYLKVITIKDKMFYLNLPIDTTILVHTKYNFIFNHESSGHCDLWKLKRWPKGQFHFEMDNFYEFIKRYENRINNFRQYMNNYDVTFIISRGNNDIENIEELANAIRKTYSNTIFKIIINRDDRGHFNEGYNFMLNKMKNYTMDNYKVCFVIANKYIRNYVSFIDYYVDNIQKFYKDSLIIIVDNKSDNVEDIRERLKPYENERVIFLTNNTECKYELGGYKVGIKYILDNGLLNSYNNYIFTQDTYVLTNKYDFNKLLINNTFACPIKGNITDNYNRHSDSFFTPIVRYVLKKTNLENRIHELRLCWANSFVLNSCKVEEFNSLVSDIVVKNKEESEECERFLGAIIFILNNGINTALENIYTQEEIHPHLWNIDIPNTKTSNYFTKKLTKKGDFTK